MPLAMLSPLVSMAFFLRVGVEGQEVAGGGGVDPLLHGEAHAAAGLVVALHRIGQRHQGAGVEQVLRRGEGSQGIARPGLGGEAAIAQGLGCGTWGPQPGDLFQVAFLDLDQAGRVDGDRLAGDLLQQVGHAGQWHPEGVASVACRCALAGHEGLEGSHRVARGRGGTRRRTGKGLGQLGPLLDHLLLELLRGLQPRLLPLFARCHACLLRNGCRPIISVTMGGAPARLQY